MCDVDVEMTPDTLETGGVNELFVRVTVDTSLQQNRQFLQFVERYYGSVEMCHRLDGLHEDT